MRVLVTGAASFIGSAVVRRLLEDGSTVYAVVRPGSESTGRFEEMLARDYPEMLIPAFPETIIRESPVYTDKELSEGTDVSGIPSPQIRIVELDLQEIEKLPEIINAAGQDKAGSDNDSSSGDTDARGWDVFLHAGWEGAGSANREKEDVQQSNVTQTLAALRTAAVLGCRRFVFTGSQAEYGLCKGPADEDTPTDPVSPYGKAKVAVSKAAVPLSRELGIDYVHARLYSIYGPGDHPWSLVSSCLRAWKRREAITLGPCTQAWNFLYIDDAAEALCTLLKEGGPGFYNIASEDTRPLADYIREMVRICSAEGLYTFGDRPQNAEGAADLIPDTGRIKRDTSWRPKTSFKEGISKMWEMEGE